MSSKRNKQLIGWVVLFLLSLHTQAQQVKEPEMNNPEWKKSYPPFRIVGNLYYVGTYDLASYLIATPQGHILINTGLASSESQIKANLKTLGFKFSDIKILLTNQVHFDHVGAMAALKKSTGAQLMVDEKDADVLLSGGKADYELGKYGVTFAPVRADRLLKDGDTIQLGDMKMVMLHHPGHTKGSCSFLFTVRDDQQSYRVLIANIPTIITDKKFGEIETYATIEPDYAYTLQAMKGIQFDLWFVAHASQFHLHEKHKPGDTYNPGAFKDQPGYERELADQQKRFDEKVKADKK
jgi:metallo-beta-lactamase class B